MFKMIFNPKYKFFKKKLSNVQCTIWDLDFKIAKSRQVREGVRQDRDRAIETVNQIENALKGDLTKEERTKIEGELATFKENVERYEAQMKMIDQQIEGGHISQENPAGIGIKEQMASLAELREMIKDYIKKI